jgi:hypothetical protein
VRLLALLALLVTALAPARAAAAPGISVSVDRTTIATRLGLSFVFHSTITNRGSAPFTNLIAHLNVLSLNGDVYVDPEDWSSHRTRYLPPIPAGHTAQITWKLSAVNAGHLGVYIAAIPRRAPGIAPSVSPTVRVTIADRRTLDSGGILPLAIGPPILLGLLTVIVKVGRRRRSHRAPDMAAANAE